MHGDAWIGQKGIQSHKIITTKIDIKKDIAQL